MERNEFISMFRKAGWGSITNPQARSIFDFLMNTRNQVDSNDILLDLGAGQCRYRPFFEHCQYISIDFGQGDKEWDFGSIDILGDITKLYFIKDNSVDFCLNTTTLEHINEPSLFFNEVNRILKPGGRLFLYVPFVIAEHQIPYDFFRFTSYGLGYLCKKNGLNVISINPSNGPLHTGIRLASYGLGQTSSSKIHIKILLKGLKGIFKYLLFPLFDHLEVYSTTNNLPQCWILIAEKEGIRKKLDKTFNNKQQVIESIIQCPHCKSELKNSSEYYMCSKCQKIYLKNKDQVIFLEE